MTASYRDSVGAFKYGSPTVNLTKPSGAVENDVLTAVFFSSDPARTLTGLPADWSLVANFAEPTTSPKGRVWVCKKKLGSSEPASYDFVFNYAFNGATVIRCDKDGADVSIAGVGDVSAILSHPYSVAASSIAVPDDNSLLVWIGGLRVTTLGTAPEPTPPSGFTLRDDVGASGDPTSLYTADKVQASAGASGAATGSVARSTGGNGRGFGVLLAISPSGGSSTVSASGEPWLPKISAVDINETTVSLPTGNTADLVVTVRDQDGDPIRYLTGTHTPASSSIATVSQLATTDTNGQTTLRITGVAVGSTTISVDFDGVVRTITVEVVPLAISSIIIIPVSAVLQIDTTQQFTAYVEDAPADVTWSVESGGGSVSSTGLYTAPSTEGSAVVRATLNDTPTVYNEALVEVYIPSTTSTVTTVWKLDGIPFANQPLDYIVKTSDNSIIAYGTGLTSASGALVINVLPNYSGQNVVVHVENMGPDGIIAGKVHGSQMVMVI